jgi:hypothetical protein
MRTQISKYLSCGLLLSVALFSTSCKEDQLLTEESMEQQGRTDETAKLGIPTKFDEWGFAQRIEDHLDNVGFGYSIFIDGKEFFIANGGDGMARKHSEENGSPQVHGAFVKQETLETTQYVTALTVLSVMKKHNLSLTTKVWPYLPKHWKVSDKFKTLDFERLLAHRTGLINHYDLGSSNDWSKVKLSVSGAVNETIFASKAREINDINYMLLGIITPYVEAVELSKKGNATMLNKLNEVNDNFATYGQFYRNLVRSSVFVPAGLDNAAVIDWQAWKETGTMSASLSTQGYPTKNGNEPGIDKAVIHFNCGVTGLYLSASQFTKLASAVAQFKVVSLNDLTFMKTKLLGFDGKLVGTKGTYHYKKGQGDNCETIFFDFGKIQVSVFANSPQSDLSNPVVIATMFENSFIPL